MGWPELQEYGIRLQHHGRFEDSVDVLRQSLRMEPNQGMGYYRLAEAKCFEIDDRHLTESLLPIYTRNDLVPEGRIFLCFALGKAFDNAGDYESAMRYFVEGNDLFYGMLRGSNKFFDPEMHQSYVETIRRLYSKDLLESFSRHGSSDETPIFIVGMIRSGTTLLDQIVSSHSQVSSAGEQEYWKEAGILALDRWFNKGPDFRELKQMAEDYLFVLRVSAGDSPRITDKMPLNYENMGLIHMAFPRAKFIHIRRSPADTGLSVFQTLFGSGPPWTYNRRDIVSFYRSYLQFMDHWRTVVPPDRLLELDYEDLIRKPEETTREVLEFCELAWEDECLNYTSNRGIVKTPSRWQARQPVYSSSMERWRKYEPWLGDLRAILDIQQATS
jgi:hypothetical protein